VWKNLAVTSIPAPSQADYRHACSALFEGFSMKILMFPNFRHGFEFAMMDGLRAALAVEGCEVRLARRPAFPEQVARLAAHFGADVVVQVNRPRPSDPPLPTSVRHITWLQDPTDRVKMESLFDSVKDGDLIYEMHPIEAVLGKRPRLASPTARILAPAVDGRLIDAVRPSDTAAMRDMVLAANMMPLLDSDPEEDMTIYLGLSEEGFARRYPGKHAGQEIPGPEEMQRLYRDHVAGAYAKTAIELNELNFGASRLDQMEDAIVAGTDPAQPWQNDKNTVDFRLGFSRAVNRALIARYMINVSGSVAFFGQNWEKWSEFRDFAGGVLRHQGQVLRENLKSRIVVHDNPNGCNLHDRVFYALGSGCLAMIPASEWDNYPGGLSETLDPDVHYAQYTRDSFYETAARWLRDVDARKTRGAAARQIILAHHTYNHRAAQILSDLKD